MGRTAGSTSSTSVLRAPSHAPDGVVVGRVVGVHGLRGELRVRLLDEDNQNLRAAPSVWLTREQGDPNTVEARVRAVGTARRGELRLALEGVDDRDRALALRGRLVRVRAEDLEPLPPGAYYQYELIGCRVEDGAGRELGVVREIWETGAPDVLVVASRDGEWLVPAAPEILRRVDLEARCVVIDAPPGLLDAPAAGDGAAGDAERGVRGEGGE